MEIELLAFDYHSSLLYDAVQVYCTVWKREKDNSTIFFRSYAQQANFVGYVACLNSQIVGFAMGTASNRGQWWHNKVAKNIGINHPALDNAWVLVELAVLAEYRHQTIATVLHEHILNKQPYANVLLSTQVDNIPARRFYEKHAWNYLHDAMVFNKSREHYCIMHKEIANET